MGMWLLAKLSSSALHPTEYVALRVLQNITDRNALFECKVALNFYKLPQIRFQNPIQLLSILCACLHKQKSENRIFLVV